MNLLALFRRRFAAALAPLTADANSLANLVKAAQDPKFGDYQANCAMPLAKHLGEPPRKVAERILASLDVADLCELPQVAGPGFINLTLSTRWLEQALAGLVNDERLGMPLVEKPLHVVIDFSAPNVAKPMHVGHIRSTVIGAALYRLFQFAGHDVKSDNHVGDWGTQFGMILYGYKHFLDRDAYALDPVTELARLYREVNRVGEEDPEIARGAREETAKLHAFDPENVALWREFVRICRGALDAVYERLHVTFDMTLGESAYQDQLAAVVRSLEERGIAQESEGAMCVFIEGNAAPFIVRKSDGAYTYATSDLATIRYRAETLKGEEILYVVDARQGEHFKLLFATARRWGYDRLDLRHVSFGTILGEDKRPFKTRSGDTVGLESLLDEAVERARRIVNENDDAKETPELDEKTRTAVAEAVGIGGIKYADLRHNRESDYVFSWDKMLALTGDTATYIQYSYARICGIFRKGSVDRERLRRSSPAIHLRSPAERRLAVLLLRFPESIEAAIEDCRPHFMTQYVFTLADAFTTFYEECPVLKEPDEELRHSRLILCDLTARMLKKGLWLLGIDTCEQM
ncbi:MAG TPA: arginine--tRNA ligase [Planctomycetaceae bacterium]|jgi:arginyl-tRNA synthetase|nr:arginine--tRNA ligase [Planctomycetaceae bacterium]